MPEQTRDDQFALAEDENWLCGICKFTNRNGRPSCYKCNARHPHRQHKSNAHPRAKDNWSCPTCAQFNYAFRFSCIKCKRASSHPPQPMKPVHRNLLKPGDWLCTNAVCRAVNHNNRPQCYRCDTDARKTVTASPVAAVQPSDDGFAAPVGKSWRKPEQKKTVAPALTNRQRLDREAEKGFKMNVGGGFASLAIDDDGEDDDDEDEE